MILEFWPKDGGIPAGRLAHCPAPRQPLTSLGLSRCVWQRAGEPF